MASLVIGALAVVIEMFGFVITPRAFKDSVWIAFQVIFQFFTVFTVFGILKAATHAAIPLADPKHNATYNPDAPEEQDPGLHRRFTYTGPKDPEQPPPVYETPTAYKYQVPQQHYNPTSSEIYPPTELSSTQVYESPIHNHRG
jgi:hypothetical protein